MSPAVTWSVIAAASAALFVSGIWVASSGHAWIGLGMIAAVLVGSGFAIDRMDRR